MRYTHRKIAILVVASLCALLFSCGHNQLDRETAEKLIREKNQLPGAPLVLVLHSPAWVAGTRPGADATRQSNLGFLENLAKAGVIRWQPEARVPVGFVNGSYVGGAETVRPFEAISQEGVVQRHGRPFEGDDVLLTLAVPELKEVTGISQQEAAAMAEVGVDLKPTPLYDRLQPLIVDILARCGGLPSDYLANHVTDQLNFAVPAICRSWPTKERLASSRIFRFRFQKYDDGWRLEG
ncbi:MAG TPA: hypothetical protein VOA87_02175 [Thermoanaerobaculia bacterium]|nr:hypothetical protein [Thermoanaerobaculia bacterium]